MIPRRIAVLTTGRQDYGILRSTLLLLRDDPRFDLRVWAGGMHLSAAHGMTVRSVEADQLNITERLDFLRENTSVAEQSARCIELVTEAIERDRPECLVLLGDRTETAAAALAATLAGLPIVHLHGGEETEGAIDNALRHAITKMAHLHLVSHALHAERVLQMGEDPSSVTVVGAPGLDNLYRSDLPSVEALEKMLGLSLDGPLVIVTVHPTTLGDADPAREVRAVSDAMERVEATYVITMPNADAGGRAIREHWTRWAHGRPRVVVRDALGADNYWALLRRCDAVLGNSSSGLIEAPSAGAAVVNVGDRQKARLRSEHVVDVPAEADAIVQTLGKLLTPSMRDRLRGVEGLYPKGPAGQRIVEAIVRWKPPIPPRKSFTRIGSADKQGD